MLELKNIKKTYVTGDNKVEALKGETIAFRKSEFVAILGHSGCGKTTLLNIVGGLDRYTSGDLIINGRSTKQFKPYDWDAYRNSYIGFVFQSYNLIGYQSVQHNVELSLTISGIKSAERKQRAAAALEKVGLKDQIGKKPNQLSGGQMQRVAIARAIVNDPSIILADEPTGALDSETSVQVMEILKEIASDRLIVMVTHNAELAEQYATRIITLKDGSIISDSNPYNPSDIEKDEALINEGIDIVAVKEGNEIAKQKANLMKADKKAMSKEDKEKLKNLKKQDRERRKSRKDSLKKTSMTFPTALSLSGKNLMTKKGRTFLISLAGSIGIIGIALVLAISNGFNVYINRLQGETLSSVPITISPMSIDMSSLNNMGPSNKPEISFPKGDDKNKITVYTPEKIITYNFNVITKEYIDYLEAFDSTKTKYIDFVKNYQINLNLFTTKPDNSLVDVRLETSTLSSNSMMGGASIHEMLNNSAFMESQYDVLDGRRPEKANEVAIIVDKYNKIDSQLTAALGFSLNDGATTTSDYIGKTYKVLHNDNFYSYDENTNRFGFKSDAEILANYNKVDPKDINLEIVGVLRVTESASVPLYSNGLIYTQNLTQAIIEQNKDSKLVKMQGKENVKSAEKATAEKAIAAIAEAEILGKDMGDVSGYNLVPKRSKTSESKTVSFASENISYLDALPSELIDALGLKSKESLLTLIKIAPLDGLLTMLDNMQLPEDSLKSMKSLFTTLKPLADALFYQSNIEAINKCAGSTVPTSLSLYPTDFESKAQLLSYLNAWNNKPENAENKIYYLDSLAILGDTMGTMIDIISYVLIAFAAVSLVVSSIMIFIITYTSVIERTKEIGVLRSLGARQKDISRLFNAETVIIGFISGLLGVLVSLLLTVPINAIINAVIVANGAADMNIGNLAVLNPIHAIVLVAISIVITFISGFIPSRMAAKKDPVVALRTE